ncbi:UTP20, small subunit (SSU) processome component [Trichuris trichiura]|uniref:UTP20, small subunit (SSU) processome component n=1 Tax=Trichuris trichiura TaxID=36087 RepID=A0A077ZAC4_TRITR|nr:UTP20, small subunit (SSU) processome component [Trichuris trichiura]
MKSHKGENRFKFVGFTTLIRSIHVDVVHQAKPYTATPDDAETFFARELATQSDLNYSHDFENFAKEISSFKLSTYALLIHHQDAIVGALKKHLAVEKSLCLKSLLELTIAICRDLHEDFQPHLWDFFEIIVALLDGQENPEILECCFSTVAYLLKFSWRRLLNNMEDVFNHFEPLLSRKKEYVRRFASEAMVFFIRKSPAFPEVINLCFTKVEKGVLSLEGFAELFVQCLLGPQHCFHSTAPMRFEELLKYLRQYPGSTSLSSKLLSLVNGRLVSHATSLSSQTVFDCLCKNGIISTNGSEAEQCYRSAWIAAVFDWVAFKDGKLLSYEKRLSLLEDMVLPLLQAPDMDLATLRSTLSLIVELFRSTDLLKNISAVNSILSALAEMGPKFEHEVLALLEETIDMTTYHSCFSSFLTAYLSKHLCSDNILSNDRLLVCMCRLFCKRESYFGGISLGSTTEVGSSLWKKRFAQIRPGEVTAYLTTIVRQCAEVLKDEIPLEWVPRLTGCCLVFASVLNMATVNEHLLEIAKHLINRDIFANKEYALTLGALIQCLSLDSTALADALPPDVILADQRWLEWRYPFVLRTADLYFLQVLDSGCSVSASLINASLQRVLEGLLVPFQYIRILSLSVLRSLCSIANFEEGANLVQLCCEAENVPITIADYRNRLMLYRKTITTFGEIEIPTELANFGSLLLYFFAGQLRVNFSLLWGPLLENLEAAFRNAPKDVAWTFLYRLLLQADDGTRNDLFSIDSTLSFSKNESALESFVLEYASLPTELNSRVDATGFRYHLWTLMEKISDVASSFTEVLSPLLIKTFDTELHSTILFGLSFENLEKPQEDMEIVEENDSNAKDDEDGEPSAKTDFKTLIAMLRVFANFKNCSAVHENDSLRQLYLKLLLHYRSDLQKAALCCLFNYYSEEEIPNAYRDKLEGLLDDKMFRERLVLLGEELQAEDADFGHLLTILLRLLYGRIQGKRGASRKGQVFAFLARWKSDYVTMFLELMLSPLQSYLDSESLTDLLSCHKFNRSIPFAVMAKMFDDLTGVVKRLGHKMEKRNQRMVFKMIMLLCTILQRICESKSNLARYAFLRAKKLKKSALTLVALFLRHFPEYPFLSEELETLFAVALWPSLVRDQQNVELSAGLYDVLVECSRSAYYWPLLVCKPNADCNSAISFLMGALECSSLVPATEDKILSIIFNLSTLADDCAMHESSVLANCQDFSDQHALNIDARSPDAVVMSYADILVNYFTKKSSERLLREERTLTILCRLAEKATSSNDSLLPLLLRQIPGASLDEDSEILLLKTTLKLLRCTNCPADYLNNVVSLYTAVNRRKSKILLNEAFSVVVEHDEDYRQLQAVVNGLNAWNQEQVEEPDYATRLANHKLARQLLNEIPCPKLRVCFRVLTYCCFDELKSTSDFSLRSNASSTLEVAILCLKNRLEQADALPLLTDLFLKQIKAGLKSNVETVRHDMVTLLRHCVLNFERVRELTGLRQLLADDDETDFFLNIRHIQVHYRAKTLRKLCDKLEDPPAGFQRINATTLSCYVLPLALPVLKDPLLLKHTGYVDEVVRFIKCYSQCCPWRRYCFFLQHYLKLLAEERDKPKLLTKIIVAILDGFHFDVKGSASCSTADNASPADRRSKEMQRDITKVLLPKLKEALVSRSAGRKSSRLYVEKGEFTDEEEQVIRVPIALAIVKLLHKLPDEFLAAELNSVLLKVCGMLRSRSLDFRRFARKALYSIAQTLGGRHLDAIIKNLKSLLFKGFRKHVLTFTVHGLLDSLKEDLSSADIGVCLQDIMEICRDELFGEIREERKSEAVIRSVWEIKFSKVFRTFSTLGELVGESGLPIVIEPLQEVIRTSTNHEAIQSVAASLREFAIGLSKNERIPKEAKLSFAFQILTEALPHTFEQRPLNDQVEESEDYRATSDCYLLPPEPGRRGVAPKFSKGSNFHLLVTFALEILWSLLRGGKLPVKDVESFSLLDPFVDPLATCLKTSYPSVVSKALRCLRSCVRYSLRSLETAVSGLSASLFDLLQKYVGLGAACRGESFEVLAGSFKLIAAMIMHLGYFTLNDKEAEILLRYVEEDLADVQKHAIAFSVVKAVVTQQYLLSNLQPVIDKLKRLAVVSSSDHIRDNCRLALANYVKCRLKAGGLKISHLRQMVEFFCTQLCYSVEAGRISALEMIAWFIANLSSDFLSRIGYFLFVNLSARLVNDQSEKCKEMAALALKSLVPKVSREVRKDIILSIIDWVKGEKVLVKEIGAFCISSVFEISFEKGNARKSILFSVALKEVEKMMAEKAKKAGTVESRDRVTFVLLTACCKAVESFTPKARLGELSKVRKQLLGVIDAALEYDHLWVRLASSQLLESSMALFNGSQLSLIKETEKLPLHGRKLSREDLAALVSFCKKLFAHLADNKDSVPLAEQATKNLVHIAKCTPEYSTGHLPSELSKEDALPKLSLQWMAKRMARMCRFELVSNSKSVIQRSYVFKWTAAVFLSCHKNCLNFLLDILLPPVYRECSVGDNETLKNIATDVCQLLKEKVGLEMFSEQWLQCRNFATAKQMLRKQRLATQADVQNLKKEVERLADHNKKLNIFVNQVKYAYEATPTMKSIKDISSKAESALDRIEKGLNELEWKKCSLPPPQLIIGDHVDEITRIVDEVIEKIEKYCRLIRPLNEAFAGKMKTLQDMRADSIRVRKELVDMRSRVNKLETILATTHLLEDSALSNDFK